MKRTGEASIEAYQNCWVGIRMNQVVWEQETCNKLWSTLDSQDPWGGEHSDVQYLCYSIASGARGSLWLLKHWEMCYITTESNLSAAFIYFHLCSCTRQIYYPSTSFVWECLSLMCLFQSFDIPRDQRLNKMSFIITMVSNKQRTQVKTLHDTIH